MRVRTLIIGAGAAGMFCAANAGPDVLIVDHAKKPGEKIRISGGGRCNFTNLDVKASNYISRNPHFAKSALARYTPWDFIGLVSGHGIAWHEKTLGQLFCDDSAKDIIAMLQSEMDNAGAKLMLETSVEAIEYDGSHYTVILQRGGRQTICKAEKLVIATGGKSIPKMGATGFAYKVAEQFGLSLTDTRPALVPFTFSDNRFAAISGIATPVTARADQGPAFAEAMLCTHRGLSGPAMLQVSSYWQEGEDIHIDLAPTTKVTDALKQARKDSPRKSMTTALGKLLPARLVDLLKDELAVTGNCAEWSDARIDTLACALSNWSVKPTGTEGYRTAEVTLGGVDTEGLSSQTMEAKNAPGLYFIGESVDVTGWLGGYNFQWAWASAHAAGQAIA
ncbi:BaiN/RdsA family NAD(P)/FAD-dependent oxidoreductase [Marivivens aquimaris]|uniref:NAD(P)/FAD-dependent oxidoreductase n=1 Tax=Marivivens aquimaris TaxID=2774876 RepID=UPI00188130A4|nr:NAD(P)/FAD-dependent oxidoreductase [Marivivens aquimaris]